MTIKVVGGWYQYCLVYISSLFFDKLFFDNFLNCEMLFATQPKTYSSHAAAIRLKILLLSNSINGLWNSRIWFVSHRSRVMWRYLCVICHIRKYKYQCWISPNLIHSKTEFLKCWQLWDVGDNLAHSVKIVSRNNPYLLN